MELCNPKVCQRCGTVMERKIYNGTIESIYNFNSRIFCSKSCARKTGIRSLGIQARHRISRAMRKSFCEQCGISPESVSRLHAHHVNGDWMDNSPENVKTLCVSCHTRSHKGFRKPCTVCGILSHAKNLCHIHYQRAKAHGDPVAKKIRVKGVGWVFEKDAYAMAKAKR